MKYGILLSLFATPALAHETNLLHTHSFELTIAGVALAAIIIYFGFGKMK